MSEFWIGFCDGALIGAILAVIVLGLGAELAGRWMLRRDDRGEP